MRLFPRLLLSFGLVVLIGVVVVSLLANQAAAREVRGYMFQGGLTPASGLAQELAGYYAGHGSWEGVETLLARGMGGHGRMMGQRLIVADSEGLIVADTSGARLGQTLTDGETTQGVPIEITGARVGTLLASGGMMSTETDLVDRVNRAIWLAAAAAGLAALLVGGLLAYGLVRPIRQLTTATQAVARGDLSQRVPVSTRDEVGELGQSFNQMADALQEVEQLRRDMTTDIAHELRNPLAVLQGNLEAILDGILPPTAENLQPLLDQTRLLSRLVNDLRTLSLADAGQLRLTRLPTAAGDPVRAVLARFAAQAEAKPLTLQAEIADGLPSLAIDSMRIEQVLANLVSNALRYTPVNGAITVRAALNGSGVLYSVEDTGIGIPAEALAHLFERFYRVERSRTRAEGGSGLGLAIARQLVEAHGGRIWAENRPAGGAAFHFMIPLQ